MAGGLLLEPKKRLFVGEAHSIITSLLPFGSYVAHSEQAERESERFSSHFIFYISGTRAKRDEHRTTSPPHTRTCIACYHSNVVIILGPHSFPSNECKSTPSPLASDGSWQEDVAALNLGCTFKTALS